MILPLFLGIFRYKILTVEQQGRDDYNIIFKEKGRDEGSQQKQAEDHNTEAKTFSLGSHSGAPMVHLQSS